MNDVYLLLTPLLVGVLVALLAFAGCATAAPAVPLDILVFIDFDPLVVTVSEARLLVRWFRPELNVGSEVGALIVSTRAAFDRGVTRLVATGTALDVSHNWSEDTCRITFVNVPIADGHRWEITCELTTMILSPPGPRRFPAFSVDSFSMSRSDPYGVRFRLRRATPPETGFFFSRY